MSNHKYEEWAARKAKEREGVLIEARNLIAVGEFDAADRALRTKDDSLEAAAALAKVYRESLRSAVAAKATRPDVEALFHRAKLAAWHAYPEPHTEVEGEDYERGRAEDFAELVRIVGYTPPEPAAGRARS
jgi:hypothetical protein